MSFPSAAREATVFCWISIPTNPSPATTAKNPIVSTLDLWDQVLTRHLDGLMSQSDIDGWSEYFGACVTRHVSEAVWQRLQWQWPGEAGSSLRQAVESALRPGSNE